jgi:3-phenylpropionate/trans-cinnamate dioxygenase ferredoxin reductase subunit
LRDGQVSTAIGSSIREGHSVDILGPFGSAFLRPGSQGRLVLVASDTAFAAVWSIAVAALLESPRRHVIVVVGARTLDSLYMTDALCALACFPNVAVIPVVQTPQDVSAAVRIGGVADHIPRLSAEDSVHVFGPPPLVEAVRGIAAAADASCYCAAFVPQGTGRPTKKSALSRARDWLKGAKQHPLVSAAARRAALPQSPHIRELR